MSKPLLQRCNLPLQPLHRPLVPLEKPPRLLHNLPMILIHPPPLLPTQQPHINQLPTHGHHGHMLEPQIRLLPEPMRRLHFPRHDDILNADAEIPVLVVPRLVGQHIPRRERDLAVLDPRADANRALVHIEVRPHAVTRAVAVIEAFSPQELASEGVERETGCSLGEDGGVESDDALQDEGVGVAFHGCWGAEVQGARRVGRAVEVLGARVAEVDGLGVDGGAVAWFGFVVDDGGVGAGGGDGVEGEAGEVVLGSGVQILLIRRKFFFVFQIRDLRPYRFELVSCLDFIQCCSLSYQFFFQPGEVLAQRRPVSNVTSSHPF